jgi:branched-chain amino acid transport system ATP-binding protein
MAVLEISNISKRFGGLLAVSEASLQAQAGRITALIGPNGAGKTTLFAIIAGFLRPDSGSVRFDGRDVTGMAPHRICGLGLVRTFQIVQPFGALSVRENIAVGAHLHERARARALEQAEAVARQVGMEAQLDKPAQGLTIAGRKRLELARALATAPKLLLLDEVMAGLNPTEIDEIVPVIQRIRASGVTVLLIEHVMRAVLNLSDHVYVLNQGRIIAAGAPREVACRQDVIEAYLGRHAAARMSEAAGAA